ncbi:Hypothetical predicted protein [Mytilus galloprovincialis]|uniref:Uncharacterized protein n=1 Tax=Mytilus galloprovincialis TaxID=29158 RepID=A0A8B6ESE3_MYTGA|nr:Hypothetical predicted protein [Mytilus galloprovincialis]
MATSVDLEEINVEYINRTSDECNTSTNTGIKNDQSITIHKTPKDNSNSTTDGRGRYPNRKDNLEPLEREGGRPEKILKIVLTVLLFLVVGICSFIIKITVFIISRNIYSNANNFTEDNKESNITTNNSKSAFLKGGNISTSCLLNASIVDDIDCSNLRSNSSNGIFIALFGDGYFVFSGFPKDIKIGLTPYNNRSNLTVVLILHITCSFIMYKASKTACRIRCQIIGFYLPIMTSAAISGIFFQQIYVGHLSANFGIPAFDTSHLDMNLFDDNLLYPSSILLYISTFILLAKYNWKHGYTQAKTSRIFVSGMFCGIFSDVSMLLNRRRNDNECEVIIGKEVCDSGLLQNEVMCIQIVGNVCIIEDAYLNGSLALCRESIPEFDKWASGKPNV